MESRKLELPVTPSLQWLPDESLFSLCSRHHRLWGHPHAWQTSQLLFGGRRAGTQHDFPASLDDLADRTGGQWGTAESIATARTAVPRDMRFESCRALGDVWALTALWGELGFGELRRALRPRR